MKQFFSIPVQLIIVILGVLFFGDNVPHAIIRGCYTFSITFKEFLSLLLPFMVFFFVTSGIFSFKKNAPLVLATLFSAIFISNAIVALLSFVVMQSLSDFVTCNVSFASSTAQAVTIPPYFSFVMPFSINSVYMLIAAIFLGLVGSFVSMPFLRSFVRKGKQWVEYCLNMIFIPLLPLYILGFLLEIRAEGTLSCLLQQYSTAFIIIVSLQVVYLAWFYFLASGFSFSKAWKAIRIAFPSYITAFGTMSSTAATPVSIETATKNTGNSELAAVAMPIMANVHLLGDSVVTPILAMVTMLVFKGALPTFATYIGFVLYFCVSMFAASGVPGGGLLVMIPILKSQLGFTPEMVSVITTIYFLLDSFGTGANVMGDGALVIMVNKILQRLRLI